MRSVVGRSLAIAILIVVGALLAVVPASSAELPQVPVTDLGTLPGDTDSAANAINDAGQVVGWSVGAYPDVTHAFLWDRGTMTDLGTLGGSFSQAYAINDVGQVVGQSSTASLYYHAFLWYNGTMKDLGTLGGPHSLARGINRAGDVVGSTTGQSGRDRAFLWSNGTMKDLGTLGGDSALASGINDAGQIVGGSDTFGRTHAFLWENGVMTDLGTLGDIDGDSMAFGINEAGQVVGYSDTASRVKHAFVWENGAMTDLGDFDGIETAAAAINDAGQVVGRFGIPSGSHALLWEAGNVTDLGTYFASGINNHGQIVGGSLSRSNHWFAALWTTPFAVPPYLMTKLAGALSAAVGVNAAGQAVGYITGGDACDEKAFLWEHGVLNRLNLTFDCARAAAINAAGQVVGTGTHRSESDRGFFWDHGVGTELGTLGGYNSWAYGINDAARVVGWSSTASGYSHAFQWQNGTMTDLGVLPGDVNSAANAINNAGQVVGGSSDASGVSRAFLWENGTMTDLGTPPGDLSAVAYAINAAGQVVGWSYNASGSSHALLWENSTITELGSLGGDRNEAYGINDAGQIVGVSRPQIGGLRDYDRAVIWDHGAITDLGVLPGDTGATARGINDAGQIVGVSTDGAYRAVMWIPSAEVHDVAVTSGSAEPRSAEVGTLVSISGTIQNQGDRPETFAVRASAGSIIVGTMTVDLGAGASEPIAFSWDTSGLAPDSYRIRIEADPVPQETDLADNTYAPGSVVLTHRGWMLDLGTLPYAEHSVAQAVNGAGVVVGASYADDAPWTHAFLWDNGSKVDLGTLGGKHDYSWAYGINDAGQVVGTSYYTDNLGDSCYLAFLWQNGTMKDLGLGYCGSAAYAIDNAGHVAGTLNSDGNGAWHAFLWQNGLTKDLGTLGGRYSSAYDVNGAGQVVGESELASHDIHAFLWQNGTMTDLGTPGGSSSHAVGINDAGQVAGWGTDASGVRRAFLWENGAMTDLGTLGGKASVAGGINNAGQVVGVSDSSNSSHAFLWDDGTMTDLGTLDGGSSAAYGINDASQVVGDSRVSTGFHHAFLWPPPTTPIHNVAVIGDGGPLDVIIGTPVTIHVTAQNKGTRIETFNVTTYAGTPFHSVVIGTKTVTALAPFASESWSYTWDTTNVTPDVYPYALRFEASAVANETDLNDNTYWGPSVMVRYPAETSATPASTDVGLPISFTCAAPDLPPTDLTTFTWGFGDGVVQSGANVTHMYQASGTYTAGCLVTNRNGVTAAGYETVEIYPSPSVVAAVDPSSAPAGTNLMFSATTTGGSGGFTFNWSFGDGSSAEGANVSHAYASPGDYTATITVWDSAGSTAADSVTVSIVSGPAPLSAQASATPVATDVGLPITFLCIAANGVPPYTFGWDFGDGDRVSGDSATHAYAAPGTMTATCTVTDGAAGTASSSMEVTVYPAPSVTAAVDRVDSSPGTVLTFEATIAGGSGGYTYTWDFGDHDSASGAMVTHAYVAPGQYAASVLARDTAGGVATDSVTVHVSNLALTLSASAISVTTDAVISFQATADGGAGGPYTFAWDFGDQTTAMGEIVSHAYAEGGTKTASCTVTDASGVTRTESMSVQVYSTPSVSAAVDHAAASPGSALAFSAAATGGSGDFVYTWDFGDNSGGSGAAVTHAYASPDEYTARVTVQDSVGGSASSAVTVTVSNVAVTATANRATESPGKSITFSAAALGGSGGFAYHWVFGDDSTADGATVMHAFASAGLHSATVTATDSLGGSGSASVVVTVSSTSVIALSSATSASTGDTITFTASAGGGAGEPFTFAWDFGDGAKGTGATVTHAYGSAGSYTPKLTVTDASGSTAEKVLEPITVRSPTPTPTPTPSGSPDLSFFTIWGVVAFGIGAVLALYVLRRKPRAP